MSYKPDIKIRRTEKRQAQDLFPALLAFNDINLSEQYELKLAEMARVAGINCRMLLIMPKDLYRFGYRLCAAVPSNLMVLAQTIDQNNLTLEQIAFTTLNFGHIDDASLKTSCTDVTDWKTVHGAVAVSTESGWKIRSLPPGFKKIREVRRLIHANIDSSMSNSSDLQEVLQMVFSDSLATISLFIEPLIGEHRPGITQKGATSISGFVLGDFWITIVGEVPLATIKLLSDSIEYKPK